MRTKGRKKKFISEQIRRKVLFLLQRNTLALEDKTFDPLNVQEILKRVNETYVSFEGRKLRLSVSIRTLHEMLQEFSEMGIAGKKAKHRERYYYLKRTTKPASFWKAYLEPFLHSMKVESGMVSYGSFILGKTKKRQLVGISYEAAILEDGIDVTSPLPWEEIPAEDIMGKLVVNIQSSFEEGFRRYCGAPTADGADIAEEKLEELQKRLKEAKLAIIYVLDGSEFTTVNLPALDRYRHSQ
jgi:hypothetical protein